MISGFYVTHKGQNYIAQSMNDKSLVFTRGEFGNGIYAGSPMEATGLINKLGPLTLSDTVVQENELVITTQFTNKVNGTVLPGFKMTEVGLYGKLQTSDKKDDPEGPEALLFYGFTTEEKADYIDPILTEYLINFPLSMSGEATIIVTIDESLVYPTKKAFRAELEKLNARINEVSQSFVAENVTLATSMFSQDSTYKDYPYKAEIPLEGVRESYVVDINFDVSESLTGIFAQVTKPLENAVVIYARELPKADIVIPTIECRNARDIEQLGPEEEEPGGDTGGGDIPDNVLGDDDIATDEEAGDVIDDVFGEGGSGGDTGGDEPGGGIATDEEVGDVIEDIFGDNTGDGSGGTGDDSGTGGDSGTEDTTPDDNVATDEEVGDIIDDIFGPQ